MNAMLRTAVATVCGTLALLAAAGAASAQDRIEEFDQCKPREWETFARAVETSDMELLRLMMEESEYRFCEMLVSTAEALVCGTDPLSCVEPAAGGDVPDLPPPPNCPPGVACTAEDTPPRPPLTSCPPGHICMADFPRDPRHLGDAANNPGPTRNDNDRDDGGDNDNDNGGGGASASSDSGGGSSGPGSSTAPRS